MPIYAYKCESCGHRQDVLQKMSDPVLSVCPACAAPQFAKQLTAAGFQLKGSGWYATDFRGGNAPAAPEGEPGEKAEKAEKGEKGDPGKAEQPATAPGKPDAAAAGTTAPPATPAAAPKSGSAAAAAAKAPAPGSGKSRPSTPDAAA